MNSRPETTLCPRVFTVSPLYTYNTFLSNPSYSDGKNDGDNATTTLPSSDITDASFIEGIWRVFSKSGISAILFLVDEYASGNIKVSKVFCFSYLFLSSRPSHPDIPCDSVAQLNSEM